MRDGRILNYDQAVGEICRVADDTAAVPGLLRQRRANTSKYRDGVYHSGDLGHILVRDGKRYLFFDGRTDDWIRKDGENFSALQVARLSAGASRRHAGGRLRRAVRGVATSW